MSVRVTAPAGWVGPAYDARHDFFGWSHGDDPAACYLMIRFGPYTEEPGDRHSVDDIVIHWNSTPLAKIREQYDREWQNPHVDRIATLRVAGQAVRVHAVYNADGHFYIAQILRGDTVILWSYVPRVAANYSATRPRFLLWCDHFVPRNAI